MHVKTTRHALRPCTAAHPEVFLTRFTLFQIVFSAAFVPLLSAAHAKGFDTTPYFGQLLPSTVTTVPLEPVVERASGRVNAFVTIRPGDTLATLAERFALTVRQIKLANSMTRDALQPGLTLKVPISLGSSAAATPARAPRLPPGASWHTVRPRETLSEIYSNYGVSIGDLVNANPGLRSLDQIHPGERLIVPGDSSGAFVQLKPGDNLLTVAMNYSLDIGDLVSANNVRELGSLQAGDYVVLPGVDADATAKRLEARRQAEADIRTQALFELARERKSQARVTLAQTSAQNANRSKLRSVQRSQTTLVRRASARYSFPTFGGGYIWPMRGVITSGYGTRGFWIGNSNFHTGVDIASGYGTPIYAAHSGYITQAGYGFFGLNVWVSVGGGVENIYGHMSRAAVYAGSYVQRGELIGYEGCSGICTGPHLHFEVRINGQHVNPLRYLP